MCGIAGILSPHAPICEARLAAATRGLAHRGPDDTGMWVARHRRVGLGHTRLSIIGIDNGHQPISNEDGTLHAAVNGEFYGFEEIRRDLRARGHAFRTDSDSEIALHLYEEYGTRCLDHLRGEFAFLLWDEARGRLFAARDGFGVKPLFYARAGDALYLASEVKALFDAGVPARWDQSSVYQQLFACAAPDRTLYDGIRQVPPGHFLLSSGSEVRVAPYWDLDAPRADECARHDGAEAVLGVRRALEDATRVRLRADVPVGCFLSGGIDSSGVLGMAAARAREPVHVFTIRFGTPAFDESAAAEATARALGATYSEVAVGDREVADHFAPAVESFEALFENGHWVARFLLSRAVREAGLKVVLAGEGADELFGGYAFCAEDRAGRPRERAAARPADFGLETAPFDLSGVERRLGFVPAYLAQLAWQRAPLRALLDGDFARSFEDRNPYDAFVDQLDVRGQLVGTDRVRQGLYVWAKSVFANYILAADRVDMAHGVEVRLPYLDPQVAAAARGLHPEQLVVGTRTKLALREALCPHVPEASRRRVKRPFLAPPSLLREGDALHDLMQQVLRSSALARLELFDCAAVVALLDRVPRLDDYLRVCLEPLLLMLVSACLLRERFRL